MDEQLRWILEQGATTASEIIRQTGRGKSTVYKQLKHPDILASSDTPTRYSLKVPPVAPETPVDVAGATEHAVLVQPREPVAYVPPAPSTGRRGRKPTAEGKRLFPEPALLQEDHESNGAPSYINNRRANSHGYRSLQLIIDNPGITTEEYVARGGRLNDLRWDLAHGNVRSE